MIPREVHNAVSRSLHRLFAGLASVVLLAVAPGCVVNRLAANRILAAPNQHQGTSSRAWESAWTNFLGRVMTNPLVSVTIAVGPPEARLMVMEVPPRDYHTKFVTNVERKSGGKGTFTLMCVPEPRNTFEPLKKPATIIVLHGYGMMKESMAPWAFLLAQAGYRVVAVDLRGHGGSTGQRIGFGKYEAADLSQALDCLMARGLCDDHVGVLGLSYGATLALNWTARDARIRTVVAIAPYNHPAEAIVRFAEMEKLPVPKKTIRGAMAAAAAKLELDWNDWSGEAGMRRLKQPVLLISGGEDPVCRPEDIRALKQATSGESKCIVLPKANHYVVGFSVQELAEPVTAWFREHMEPAATGERAEGPPAAR
jgi:pimeloyl-ACP methyl ester carboxylesterase